MARILRGGIYWADLNPVRGREQAGRRPVLVISHSELNERLETVIVLAITSKQPRMEYPLTYKIQSVDLPRESWVKTSQLRTLALERLGDHLGTVSEEELDQVLQGLFELVG